MSIERGCLSVRDAPYPPPLMYSIGGIKYRAASQTFSNGFSERPYEWTGGVEMAKVIVMPDQNDPAWKGWIMRFAAKYVLWLVFLAVALFAAAGNIYTIPSDSRGIVLRFGAISSVAEPGLHIKIPFADEVYVIPAERKQSLEFGFQNLSFP